MKIDSTTSFFNPYDTIRKKQEQTSALGEVKLANNALAHFRVDDIAIKSLNGDKMEEAMSGLRSITQSLKEILNRNLKAANENIPSQQKAYDLSEIKTELSKSANVNMLHNYDILSSKAETLLA